MDKSEKIEAIVNRLLDEMDLDALQQFYIDMKTFELEDLDEDQLDAYLWKVLIMNKIYDYLMESEVFHECMDCGHVSQTYGEIDRGFEEAEVVCPHCGSIHYYFTEEANHG